MLKPFVLRSTDALDFTAGKVYWVCPDSVCPHMPERATVIDDDGDYRAFFEEDFRPILRRDAFVMALQAKGIPAHVANLAAHHAGGSRLREVAGPGIASEGLLCAFLWHHTPEGYAYWRAVADKVDAP